MPQSLTLSGSLAVPASGTYLHPWALRITNRRDEPTAPAAGLVFCRLVDNDGVALSSKLGNTSGAVLSASTSDAWLSASGWYQIAASALGLYEGSVLVASGVTAGPIELQVGWSQDGVQQQARAGSAFVSGGAVDLSAVTDEIGASTDDQAGTTLHARINYVVDSLVGLDVSSTVGSVGTGGRTIAQCVEPHVLAYGLVTTAGGTGTVTVADFIGRYLINELLIIEDVSSGLTPKLRQSRSIASFNNATGACTVAALDFSPAVGDIVWVVPRAQTAP